MICDEKVGGRGGVMYSMSDALYMTRGEAKTPIAKIRVANDNGTRVVEGKETKRWGVNTQRKDKDDKREERWKKIRVRVCVCGFYTFILKNMETWD